MGGRRKASFGDGLFFESRFANSLDANGIDYKSLVGTDDDKKKKVDFFVEQHAVQVKGRTKEGRTTGLCCEVRAVNGSTGFLLRNDYVVKFLDFDTYKRYDCHDLLWYISKTYGLPGPRLHQQNRAPHHVWYARRDWTDEKGVFHPRKDEACIMLPFEEIERFCVSTVRIRS